MRRRMCVCVFFPQNIKSGGWQTRLSSEQGSDLLRFAVKSSSLHPVGETEQAERERDLNSDLRSVFTSELSLAAVMHLSHLSSTKTSMILSGKIGFIYLFRKVVLDWVRPFPGVLSCSQCCVSSTPAHQLTKYIEYIDFLNRSWLTVMNTGRPHVQVTIPVTDVCVRSFLDDSLRRLDWKLEVSPLIGGVWPAWGESLSLRVLSQRTIKAPHAPGEVSVYTLGWMYLFTCIQSLLVLKTLKALHLHKVSNQQFETCMNVYNRF